MRHGKKTKKLGRTAAHRKALFRNLASSLFSEGYIETTLPKAKALRPYVEKIVTKAIKVRRENTFASRLSLIRDISKDISDKNAYRSLLMVWAVICMDRQGGYTRILKLGTRKGDAAEMAYIGIVIDPLFEKRYGFEGAGQNVGFQKLSEKLLTDFMPTFELLQSWSRCVIPKINAHVEIIENGTMLAFILSFENVKEPNQAIWPIIKGEYASLPLIIEVDLPEPDDYLFKFETSRDLSIIPAYTKERLLKVQYSPNSQEIQRVSGKISNKPVKTEVGISEKTFKQTRRSGNKKRDLQSDTNKIITGIPNMLNLPYCDLVVYGPLGRIYSLNLLSLSKKKTA